MCGRFSQTLSFQVLRDYFQLDAGFDPPPLYNMAPSQEVAAVRQAEGRRLVPLHWGLIPFWAKNRKIGYKTLNARSETAHKTPSFRAAFRSRRCLIPASGFYEWDKKQGTKQPHFIHRADEQPLALAGALLFTMLFLPLDYTGYLLDRREIPFRTRRGWVWRHRRAMLGFGAAALGTFLVPGLNFLCLPWLVTAGTLLALDVRVPELRGVSEAD